MWTFFLLPNDVLSGCAIVLLTLGKLNIEIPKVNKCVHKSVLHSFLHAQKISTAEQSRQSAKTNSPMINRPTPEISVKVTKVQHMLAFQSAQYRDDFYIYIYFQILTFLTWDNNNTRWFFFIHFIRQTTCALSAYIHSDPWVPQYHYRNDKYCAKH